MANFALYAQASGSVISVEDPRSFQPSKTAKLVNAFWFASLALSLIASLLSILAKQWLTEYKSRIRAPAASPRMWALRHAVYKMGLDDWGMNLFISSLPLLLHAALFSFLSGLGLFLLPLDGTSARIVLGFTVAAAAFYVATAAAPVIWGACPTATPAPRQVYLIWNSLFNLAQAVALASCYILYKANRVHMWFMRPSSLLGFGLRFAVLFPFCWYISIFFAFPSSISLVMAVVDYVAQETRPRIFDPATIFVWSEHVYNYLLRTFGMPYPAIGWNSVVWSRTQHHIPAFDTGRLLDGQSPLYESAALSWMLTNLPAPNDVAAAIHAIASQSHLEHLRYFAMTGWRNPLHSPVPRRAVYGAFEELASLTNPPDLVALGHILSASYIMRANTQYLASRMREFWDPLRAGSPAELCHLTLLRSSLIAAWLSDPACAELRATLPLPPPAIVELKAVSYAHQPKADRIPALVALLMTSIPGPEEPEDAALRIIHVIQVITEGDTRQNTPSLPTSTDICLRILCTLDHILEISDRLDLSERYSQAIICSYDWLAQELVRRNVVPSAGLENHLLFLGSRAARSCTLSADGAYSLGALLFTSNGSRWTRKLEWLIVRNILHHLSKSDQVLELGEECWVRSLAVSKADTRALVDELQPFNDIELLIKSTRLSLLECDSLVPWRYIAGVESLSTQGVADRLRQIGHIVPAARNVWRRQVVVVRDPSGWHDLCKLVDLSGQTQDLMPRLVFSLSVMLLFIRRRGSRALAAPLARELQLGGFLKVLAHSTELRLHIAVHMREIDLEEWEVTERVLLGTDREWLECATYPSARDFVDAVRVTGNCLDCAHGEANLSWTKWRLRAGREATQSPISSVSPDGASVPDAAHPSVVPSPLASDADSRRSPEVEEFTRPLITGEQDLELGFTDDLLTVETPTHSLEIRAPPASHQILMRPPITKSLKR